MNLQTRPTTDGNALAQTLSQVSGSVRPRGLDSRLVSLLALDRIAKQEMNKPGRKLLVWPGIGWPTYLPEKQSVISTPAEERDKRSQFAEIVSLSTALREARITVYGGFQNSAFYYRDFLKGVKKETEVDQRNLTLDVLALQTGGRGAMSTVNRDSDLIDQLNSYISDSAVFYTITFDPPRTQQQHEYHDLKVVIDKPGLTAHTNTGYYNEPEYFQPEPKNEKAVIVQGPAFEKQSDLRLVSVAQLTEIVGQAKSRRDAEAAKEIEHLKLTERLSSPKLVTLSAQLPGPQSKAALMAVGDASVFLNPPLDEIPQEAQPDLAEQRQVMSQAVDYLKKVIPKLPNFYAHRFTTSFEEASTPKRESGTHIPSVLQPAGEFKATVYYREGKEIVHADGPEEFGLMTEGTFGPILSTVVVDAAYSTTEWSRWEEAPNGPMAVFRFHVPRAKSHYQASFSTFAAGDLGATAPTAYHGEFGIDPDSGAILRLVLQADSDSGSSMQRADIMVKYGAVMIGGKRYTCPVRSVSIATGVSPMKLSATLYVTRLDDVVFSGYHVFRSESRILPE